MPRRHVLQLLVCLVVAAGLAAAAAVGRLRFGYPELFLLAIPLGFAFHKWGDVRGPTGWLRLTILMLLLLSLTGPRIDLGGRGIDVIVVVDRSRSMPRDSHERIRELIQNLENNRGSGDRVGIVTFGGEAHVEQVLSATATLNEFTSEVPADGSDLNDAVATALNLVDPNRPARVFVFSDGESNGSDPLSAARRARESGAPVDYRVFERFRGGDVAVADVALPESVAPQEPFQFSATLYADRDVDATVRLFRDGKEVSTTERKLSSGLNRIQFGDILGGAGFFAYEVEVEIDDDPLPENNRGAGVVRVDAGPRLLVLNDDGGEGNFVRVLKAARIPVDVREAGKHALTQDALDPYRAVVLENVPADALGRLKMDRLAQYVEDLGGGLMLTGGERSFGAGGYFKSPLDDVIPVSMEMREEHRKLRVAIAVVLDRSGSMGAPVKGGRTKMDLANLGTAECVKLLSPADMVSVIAVDSAPHVVQEMTKVEAPDAIVSRVKGVNVGGGGIFVYEALVAAGKELVKATGYQTRHVILFSDAADSEEPGDYRKLLKEFSDRGITVSVIGLGTTADPDAKLLEDIAKLGGGNVMFTSDAQELPRLFTQDTMSVARSTFIENDPETQPDGIPGELLPDARLMGELDAGRFPNAGGYNLSYLKPDATMAVVSRDEYTAPWSAFWYRGLGRVAALTLEVDGKHTGRFLDWDGYADFLITHVRWLLGGERPDDVFVDLRRDGQQAVVTVELNTDRPDRDSSEPPVLHIVPPGEERAESFTPDYVWTGPDSLEARFRLERTGTYRTLVENGAGRLTRGPAVTLPYSPEHAPRFGLPEGRDVLQSMADLTGGTARTDVLSVLADPPRSSRTLSLLPVLFTMGLVLLVVEIAGRRLSLWKRVKAEEGAAAYSSDAKPGWLPRWKMWRQRRARRQIDTPAESETYSPAPADGSKTASVFDQAKQRARQRLK